MFTFCKGAVRCVPRGAAFALLTTLIAACSGVGSMTPSDTANSAAPASLTGAGSTYKFRTIDNPADASFNELLGIDRAKTIVGYYGSGAAGHPNKGYRLTPPFKASDFTKENVRHSLQTRVTAINGMNDTAGFWIDGNNVSHGFIHWNGQTKSYSSAGSSVTQILGLNNSGIAVGFYSSGSANVAFELDRLTGQFTSVAPNGATNVTATSINNEDQVVGFYKSGRLTVGFLKSGHKYKTLRYPKATITMPFGINNHGDVAGAYVDSSGATHGFLHVSATHEWTSYDDPNGVGTTTINGLNDRRDMVGFYVDSSGNTDGMLMLRVISH
jgi:hypothetical protein